MKVARTLSERALNRALLARQLLLERHGLDPVAAIERLVGMQSQAPLAPYVGLWTRLRDFDPEHLSRAMLERRAVRIALMRSTIFLVSAEDALRLRPVVQPVLDRGFRGGWGRRTDGLDLDAVAAVARALVEHEPLTWSGLGERLAARFPGCEPEALAQAARTRLPLVQVTPRGVWGASGPSAHTTAERWLGGTLDSRPDVRQVVLRYLAAFGPASVRDAQSWSGLTRLREVFEALRPTLEIFRDDRGAELFDVPEAPRPDPDVPAPPRFLPEFDNILLAHADRSRIFPEAFRAGFITSNGLVRGTVLLDGRVSGSWRIRRNRPETSVEVTPFRPLDARERARLEPEAVALLAFTGVDAPSGGLEFRPV